jgi:hypothetical protein
VAPWGEAGCARGEGGVTLDGRSVEENKAVLCQKQDDATEQNSQGQVRGLLVGLEKVRYLLALIPQPPSQRITQSRICGCE